MSQRAILVGTGGWGATWCRAFLPPNIRDGHVQVVAAVDREPEVLANARQGLGLDEARCYTDLDRALREIPADFIIVVVPPAWHEEVIEKALAYDLHILCEKPMSDTLQGSLRIASSVKRHEKKMAVTMSHRFDQDKTTLRHELRSGAYGPLDYLALRFTCDCRKYGTWARFRHEMEYPLLVEGAVHHLDILADLAGAPCESIYAECWTPKWGQYAGKAQALVTMRMQNGVRAAYEAGITNAVGLNGWTQEYIRAECERVTLILDNRRLERFEYDPSKQWAAAREGEGREVPLLDQPKWANTWLVEKFVRWLEGGPTMETRAEENLQSMAIIQSAIWSCEQGRPIEVQEELAKASSCL